MNKKRAYSVLCIVCLVLGLGLGIWGFLGQGSGLVGLLSAALGTVGAVLVLLAAPVFGAMSQGNAPFSYLSKRGRRVRCPNCSTSFRTIKLHDPDINPTLECPECARTFRW